MWIRAAVPGSDAEGYLPKDFASDGYWTRIERVETAKQTFFRGAATGLAVILLGLPRLIPEWLQFLDPVSLYFKKQFDWDRHD